MTGIDPDDPASLHDRRGVPGTGRSIAALIRDAVEAVYGTGRSGDDDLAEMRRAFGSWKDRDQDGAEWVDRLRSGSRLPGV